MVSLPEDITVAVVCAQHALVRWLLDGPRLSETVEVVGLTHGCVGWVSRSSLLPQEMIRPGVNFTNFTAFECFEFGNLKIMMAFMIFESKETDKT